MIIIKSKQEIDIMREAGKVTGDVLRKLEDFVKPGISTWDIDRFVEEHIIGHKMTPSFKGLYGFERRSGTWYTVKEKNPQRG